MWAAGHRRWASIVLCGLVLAGCGGADPALVVKAAAGPTALPSGGDLSSRCDDTAGDAAADDIVAVAMARDDAYLVVGFAFAGGLPTSGDLFLTVEAHSRDGLTARQLGIEIADGDAVAAYVATSPTADALRLENAVHVADGEVHAAFPLAYVRDLGDGWSWRAMAGADATVDDICPGVGTAAEQVSFVETG